MASRLARNSVANAIAGLATTLGGVISTIIIARILGVEGTGVVAFAVWVVTFALLAGDLGVPGTLTRYISSSAANGDEQAPHAVVANLYGAFAIANSALAAAFFGYAVWLAAAHDQPVLHIDAVNYRTAPLFWGIIGAAVLAQSFANFTNACLRGFGKFRKLSLIAILSAGLQVATTLIGAWFFGIAGALCGAVLGYVVPAAMAHTMLTSSAKLDPELEKRIRRYAIEAWFGFIVTAFAWSRMEVFFLERSLGSEAVGLFTAALTFSNMAIQGPMLLTGALTPFFARQAALNDSGKLTTSYAMVLRLFALAVAPACFGLAAISRELLPMLFGTGFAPSVPAAVILLVASAVMLSFSISTIYLLSLERTRVVLNFAAIGAVMMIVAGLTIIPLFGPTGAALSRAAIQLFVVSAGAWYAAKYLGAYVPLRGLAIILLAAAIMGLAAYGIADGIGGVAGILAAIASGPLVYGLMLKLLGGLPADDATELMRATALLPSPADRLAPRLIRFISADDSARRSAMPLE
ncbi:MAG: polysaccharide biosynthesis C-terminal domain-containing protein [Hyphomicrobium sp.]|nr:polysaccharide biosynthesis C-terminal domain-containing protein [Hyphomicrobium sp.]